MIGLDTNVIVRYLTQDDRRQAMRASAAIEGLTAQSPAFISCIVLCEVNWVLQTAYGLSKVEIIAILEQMLAMAVFEIERADLCRKALKLYEDGKADFSDYLILRTAEAEGCSHVLTFDKNALKTEGFKDC